MELNYKCVLESLLKTLLILLSAILVCLLSRRGLATQA